MVSSQVQSREQELESQCEQRHQAPKSNWSCRRRRTPQPTTALGGPFGCLAFSSSASTLHRSTCEIPLRLSRVSQYSSSRTLPSRPHSWSQLLWMKPEVSTDDKGFPAPCPSHIPGLDLEDTGPSPSTSA